MGLVGDIGHPIGFYIEDKGDTIYMKNDGVEMDDTTQMAQFTITVSYPSKGDYSITFKVIWGVATKDFKLEAGMGITVQ